jgi:bifunctional non-homologous end joining protein LigD
LRVRRAALAKLIGANHPASPIQFSEAHSDGAALLKAACSMGLEGIVSKKLRSTYRSGRQKLWLKTKCYDEAEFVVIGAEHEKGKPAFAFLARENADGLEYAGSAFITLAAEDRDRFWTMLEAGACSKPIIPMAKKSKARWTEPRLRVRAEYLKGSALRHATLRELL